jgi:hypothetical protein
MSKNGKTNPSIDVVFGHAISVLGLREDHYKKMRIEEQNE